ncbi:MAG: hypothetical protein JNJ88_03535 [Planctomycetes bacterium]|nr:hypothetical protein [Planctomycetota bacterium]
MRAVLGIVCILLFVVSHIVAPQPPAPPKGAEGAEGAAALRRIFGPLARPSAQLARLRAAFLRSDGQRAGSIALQRFALEIDPWDADAASVLVYELVGDLSAAQPTREEERGAARGALEVLARVEQLGAHHPELADLEALVWLRWAAPVGRASAQERLEALNRAIAALRPWLSRWTPAVPHAALILEERAGLLGLDGRWEEVCADLRAALALEERLRALGDPRAASMAAWLTARIEMAEAADRETEERARSALRTLRPDDPLLSAPRRY